MPLSAVEVVPSQDETMSNPEPGLRRQVMSYSPSMMLVRHRMKKGWVGARHSHPHEQMVYIVSGCLRFEHPGRSLRGEGGRQLPGSGQRRTSGFGTGRLGGFGYLHSIPRRLRPACLASPPCKPVRLPPGVDFRYHRQPVQVDNRHIVISRTGYKRTAPSGWTWIPEAPRCSMAIRLTTSRV